MEGLDQACKSYASAKDALATEMTDGFSAETIAADRKDIAALAVEARQALQPIADAFLTHVDEIKTPGTAFDAAKQACAARTK